MAWGSVANLKGPQGDQGPTGSTGPKGDTGNTGPAGPNTIATATDYATLSDPAAGTAGFRTLGAGSQQAAAGNHTHSGADIVSGTISINRLPTGTTGTTVSLGDHTHSAVIRALSNVGAGGTISIDASAASIFRVTTTGSTATLAVPTNASDGDLISLEILANAALTLTVNSSILLAGAAITPQTASAGKRIFIQMRCISTTWYMVAMAVQQ